MHACLGRGEGLAGLTESLADSKLVAEWKKLSFVTLGVVTTEGQCVGSKCFVPENAA